MKDIEDKLLVSGCVCLVIGVALIHLPAGVITLGVVLISLGVLIGKKKANDGIAE
jgi:hypothetical protein